MTSHDGSPPQISWWYVVVVPADLGVSAGV